MSQEALAQLIERASTDATFRSQLQSHPESALKGYDLTGDERAALLSGDSGKLQLLRVDARLTKTHGSSDADSSDGMAPFAG